MALSTLTSLLGQSAPAPTTVSSLETLLPAPAASDMTPSPPVGPALSIGDGFQVSAQFAGSPFPAAGPAIAPEVGEVASTLVEAGVGRLTVGGPAALDPGPLEVDGAGDSRQVLGRGFHGGAVVGLLHQGELSFYDQASLQEIPANLVAPSFKAEFLASLGASAAGAVYKTEGNRGLGPVPEAGQEQQTLADGSQFVVNAGQTASLLGKWPEDPTKSVIGVYEPGEQPRFFLRADAGLPFVGPSSAGFTSQLDASQVPAAMRAVRPPAAQPMKQQPSLANAAVLNAFAQLPPERAASRLQPGVVPTVSFSQRRVATPDEVAGDPDVDLAAVSPARLREALQAFKNNPLPPGNEVTFLGPTREGLFAGMVNGQRKTYALEHGVFVEAASRGSPLSDAAFEKAVAEAFRHDVSPPTDNSVSGWTDYWQSAGASDADLSAKREALGAALENAKRSGQRMTKELWDALPMRARDAYRADNVTVAFSPYGREGAVRLEKDGFFAGQSEGGSGEGQLTMFKAKGINLVADQKMGGFVQANGNNWGNPNVPYIRESKLRVGSDLIEFGKHDMEVSVNGRPVTIDAKGLTLGDGSTLRLDQDSSGVATGYTVSTPEYDLQIGYYYDVQPGVPPCGDVITNPANWLEGDTGPKNYFQNFTITNKRGAVDADGLLGRAMTEQRLAPVDSSMGSQIGGLGHYDLSRWFASDYADPR